MTVQGQIIPSGFALPSNIRVYAISDIHGCLDLFRAQLANIEADLAARPCARHMRIFLGDYIDRGPDSRGVIDALIANRDLYDCVFLRGNHESFVADFLHNPLVWPAWAPMGGLQMLQSYGLDPPADGNTDVLLALADAFNAAMPAGHHQFFAQLQPSFTLGDVFFTHAGIRPGVPLNAQSEADLMWIRHDFLNEDRLHPKWIVHGHTPVREPDVRPNRINIDTGAFARGRLTCLWLEASRFGFL